ncbi:MAG: GDSL-like Lipase/Acylhydrolase [Thermoleophilia bacterium]|nr:GDSL-like Lipase/Acylhydrolase [Thermoleophilia bacterium]
MRRLLHPLLVVLAVACAGCGSTRGDGGPAKVAATSGGAKRHGSPTRVIATLGDSIVAGSPLWDPDADTRASFPKVDEDSQWQRWVHAPDAELRNCGVWGERTDEIAERFATCTKGADAVVIQGGINDIVQGRDVDDAAHDIACMAERARGAGLDVAIVDVLPWNNGWPDAAPEIRDLNREVHAIAKRGGVPVLPFFRTLEDPRAHDRMPRERTVDGNHPDVRGYRLLGERAWREPVRPAHPFADDCG